MVLSSMKGGLEGTSICSSFFVSIFSAFDIHGRKEHISWVHRSPICTTLRISFLTLLLCFSSNNRYWSINSSALPDWKCFHVWFRQKDNSVHHRILSYLLYKQYNKKTHTVQLTIITRLSEYSDALLLLFCLPVIISNSNTPKLYTSAFSVNWPCARYSGAI